MSGQVLRFTTEPVATSPATDVARRAFDATAAIAQATTLEQLDRLMRPFIATLGFTNVILTETRGSETIVVAGAPPALWWPHLVESGYQHDDVVFRAALETSAPFFYTDFTEQPDLTARQKRIIGERKEFGIAEGFVSQTHFPTGASMSVVMVGADVDARDPDVRAAAHIVSTFYSIAARSLLASAPTTPPVTLTQRQRDCLRWVREGKSATDIGAIMGISAYTVHEHVATACKRLGVRTRVQAVATAIAQRLIEP